MGTGVLGGLVALIVITVSASLFGCDDAEDGDVSGTTATPPATITETADADAGQAVTDILANDGRFETLLAVLEVAEVRREFPDTDIVSAAEIMGEPDWNLTLFAPIDAAFDGVDEETMAALLSDVDAATQFVRAHVVPTLVTSADLEPGDVMTIGGPVDIMMADGTLSYGGAQVIEADIEANNGIIHVIEGVAVQ